MIFSRSDDTLTLKTATSAVALNDRVKLGDFDVPGPGEYDVAGISAIVIPNLILTSVISAESLSILYLDHPYAIDKDSEEMSGIDIVAIRISTAEELKKAEQVSKDLEPGGLLLFGSIPSATIIDELKLNTEPVPKWTVVSGGLPDEGTDIIVLE